MRKLLLSLALLALFAAPQAQAQFVLTPYVGFNTDDALGLLVGFGAEFVAPFQSDAVDLSIQPTVEFVTTDADGLSYFQINGDVIAKFAPSGSIAPFAGAGLAIGIVSVDDVETEFGTFEGSSDTELGLNLLGGISFPGAFAFGEPYVQGRYSIIDNFDALSIMGGLRIPLGRN